MNGLSKLPVLPMAGPFGRRPVVYLLDYAKRFLAAHEEYQTRQRQLVEQTGGEFAEIGECGKDELPCGVCDECEEYQR